MSGSDHGNHHSRVDAGVSPDRRAQTSPPGGGHALPDTERRDRSDHSHVAPTESRSEVAGAEEGSLGRHGQAGTIATP
jgi:hypothetical protein